MGKYYEQVNPILTKSKYHLINLNFIGVLLYIIQYNFSTFGNEVNQLYIQIHSEYGRKVCGKPLIMGEELGFCINNDFFLFIVHIVS